MAREGEVEVGIKLKADVSGGVQSRQELEKLRQKAKETMNAADRAAKQASGGIKGFSKSVGFLRKAMTGFGVAGLFAGVAAAISKIKDSFNAAAKEAEAFRKIQDNLAQAKALNALVQGYERLKGAVAAANAEQQHHLEMIDMDVANRRRLDAAKLERDKQAALAGLDPEAEDYAERKAAIEADYAARSASMSASNAKEDIVLSRQKLATQADLKDEEAEAQDAATAVARRKLSDARRERLVAELASADLNDADKTGAGSAIGKTLGQFFTGDWGRMTGARTAEGDAVRRDAAKRAADLELRVQELEEEVRRSEEKSASLRTEAGRLRERRGKMDATLEAADIEGENTRGAARTGEEAAQRALGKKRGEIAAKEDLYADAVVASELLSRREAELQSGIAAQREKKAAANLSVFEAQGAYDLAQANGDRRGAAAAYKNLHSAEAAANEVNFEADKAIESMTAALKDVARRLKAAQSHLEQAAGRESAAWAESAGGAR